VSHGSSIHSWIRILTLLQARIILFEFELNPFKLGFSLLDYLKKLLK